MDQMNTKWGVAILNKQRGYYVINNGENRHKYLHRLIFEDFYNFKIPNGFIIHHKNENKKDNCILNLQLVHEGIHRAIHAKNNKKFTKKQSDEYIKYFRVTKQKDDTCKQGYIWRYRYIEDGKRKSIMSTDINTLKEKVLNKNLDWFEIN